ncbi:P-II family nitrogen regulator, partial [Bradyrhizobium cosmicum]|uniref:P-II family nitrogen regulator n=1 Tax=Bradyrhizobium cosmicum TaxID=1404864 RepID=UPI0028E1DA45
MIDVTSSKCFPLLPATFLCHLPRKMPDLHRRSAVGGTQLFACSKTPQGNEGLTMKLVVAIIKPFKLDEVRQALTAIGVHGMT